MFVFSVRHLPSLFLYIIINLNYSLGLINNKKVYSSHACLLCMDTIASMGGERGTAAADNYI